VLAAARGRSGAESGQVVVVFALLIPLFFALGAIVLDIGNWYVHKRHLQTQVDAAVLASAPSFAGCFNDQATANTSIANTALGYAGDTLRDATTVNQQLAEPNDVRIVLNADRYWQTTDGVTSPATGYGLDWGGNNPAKKPCTTSSLDAKATDERVRPLWGLIPLTPSPKAHAKVEIHRVREENGMLPLAVPEIDPNFVYAIFVDFAKTGAQTPLKVQCLEKNPTYGGSSFLYSAWVTATASSTNCPTATNNNRAVSIHPDSSYSDGTGVVILVSKSTTAPSMSGTLNQICGQTPTDLVQCYAGTGGDYDGAATGQGLGFVHSFDTGGGSAAAPLIRDVTLGGMVCTGGISPSNQSSPYFINDDNDCTVGVTAQVDFGTPDPAGAATIVSTMSQGGICAAVTGLTYQSITSTAPYVSTWTGTMSVTSGGGHQALALTASDKTSGNANNCNNRNNSRSANPAAVPYATDDASGPVGYLKLTPAEGPNVGTACPAGSSLADPNSVARGNYCYTVVAGLEKPLQVQPWNYPNLTLRFASKSQRKTSGNVNGALLCDHGRTLSATFKTGCFTTYALNYDKWGTGTTPYGTTTSCPAGVLCWEDVLCKKYSPPSPIALPPPAFVNNPNPDCVAAKAGTVQALQAGIYDRWEDTNNGYGGCTPNYWPKTATEAQNFFKPVDEGGHDFTNDPRYVTLIVTDNTAFQKVNIPVPVKYFAGFYVTGWDTANGNGAGKPHGCFNFPPSAGTCGAPNNDAHPLLGCLAGTSTTNDNGDIWGHFVKFVGFSAFATPSDDLCVLTATTAETCVATLVE
jgi:hypothetical protein